MLVVHQQLQPLQNSNAHCWQCGIKCKLTYISEATKKQGHIKSEGALLCVHTNTALVSGTKTHPAVMRTAHTALW